MIWFFFILSLLANIVLIFATRNLLLKYEILEKNNEEMDVFFQQLHAGLVHVLTEIRAVDIRGSFESDDEVGIVFSAIKGMIESLTMFLPEAVDE